MNGTTMPLRDHFRSPVNDHHSWEALHGGWPMVIVQRLNAILPQRYVAAPRVELESESSEDEYEVRIYDAEHGRRLVAAIELVSPRNKARPESRGHFVGKCAALLRQQVCVVLVDLVTARTGNLYCELLEWVGEHDPSVGAEPPSLYAVSCRWSERDSAGWLRAWNRPMAVGEPLPTLPLWLSDDLAIPLDLESSYEQTCRDLRIA